MCFMQAFSTVGMDRCQHIPVQKGEEVYENNMDGICHFLVLDPAQGSGIKK